MPHSTDQQLAANALYQAFLVKIIVEAKANLHEDGSDSEYDSGYDASSESSESDSGSSNSSSSLSSDEESGITTSEVILEMMAQLYSEQYFNHWEPINKDTNQLHLLLHDYKQPEILWSYVQITPDCITTQITVKCLLISNWILPFTTLDTMEMLQVPWKLLSGQGQAMVPCG